MHRRRFLGLVPGLIAVPAAAQQIAPAPTKVDRLRLDCAETIAGLDFTDTEETMALGSVNDNLESYETLRRLAIPLDTEPAITFRPYLPGHAPTGPATPGAALRYAKLTVPRHLTPEQIAFLPVTGLAALIASRQITSLALTQLYLERLKRFGDRLQCVVSLTEPLALEQAARADAEIKAGRNRGPLHGIPWGAKDLLATKGYRTTWGATPYQDQVIDLDATVVERLREAGAVLVAKLSMGALAQGGVWFGGSTRSPWNLERGSSGSSAGPGAATAAGLVGFSIGTETLGSIVSPSATNGVVGLRPTYGRVSRHGAMALSWTMDKIGPMCRGVEDAVLVLNAIYGADGRDDTVVDAPFEWPVTRPLSAMRIGYLRDEFEKPRANASPEQLQAFEGRRTIYAEALAAFRQAGANLEQIVLPEFPTSAVTFLLEAEAAAQFDDLTRSRGIDTLTGQGANDWPNTFRSARFIPAVEYIRAQRARRLLMQEMDRLMTHYDAFISPAPGSGSLTVTNLTGHPAIALPCGFVDQMPASIMVTGRLYHEATICQIALAFERATTWHTQHPTLT